MRYTANVRNVTTSFVLLLTLSGAFHAFAWSSAGHEVIAAEAWRELSPQTRAKVTEVLKAHPDYEKWESLFKGDSANLDLAAFAFMRASTWPDQIRRHGNKYDHPSWHYIDYPLRPPSFSLEPGPSPDNDILYGVQRCETLLGDLKTSAEERAVYLSWLLHLVGDIHQPLHCGSLFSETYPTGDRGGNLFYVKPASRGISLHSLWDGLLGKSGKSQTHLNYAIRLQSEHAKSSLKEIRTATSPKAWSLESRALAIDKAYLRGQLNGSVNPEDAPPPPVGYTKIAKEIAERQAALAGYRLADEIRALLK